MIKYIDKYGSTIFDYEYRTDKHSLKVPFIRPRDVFIVPSESGKFETRYIRLNMSLDIETTTRDGLSAPYIMTISLNVPNTDTFYIYHFRSWDDTQEFCDAISEHYGVGAKKWSFEQNKYVEYEKWKRKKRVLLCYIHNASYEFSFCRTELKFSSGEYDFFTKDSRKMMKAVLENGIEFRDSMALTNSSLEQLSKNYCKHKKIKDLDYKKQRNTLTPIDDEERRYINEDCIILNEFETVFIDKMCYPGKKIPLTNTARLLLKVESRIGIYIDDIKAKIRKMQPTAEEIIEASKYLFRGGLVHGNIRYLNMIVRCLMRDITSSYPYTMLTKYMPMGKFVEKPLAHKCFRKGNESKEFREILSKYCVIIDATYYNLRAITDHSYESISKVKEFVGEPEVKSCDNGRIRYADEVRVLQTELDYECYNYLYDWDVMEIHSIKFAVRGMLPEWLLSCVAEDYKGKNDLKVAGLEHTTDYALKKIDVNSYFGMCCKSVYEANVTYDFEVNDWGMKDQSIEDIQKDLDKRFMDFYWGVWICAHSRAKLVRMIVSIEKAGGHVVYYDTDSLKYIPSPDGATERIFEEENARIREERKQFPLLADPSFGGKSGKGLGEWDSEHNDFLGRPCPVLFKVLGAKRYMYHAPDGKFKWNKEACEWEKEGVGWKLCVAGLPKKAGELLPSNPFEFFSIHGFSFAGDDTGKLRPDYIDHEYDVTITDDYGNTETIHCKSGVNLVPVDFDITEKKLYNIITQHKEFIGKRRAYLIGGK